MTDDFVRRIQNIRIGPGYQLTEILGSGSFGKVYSGKNSSSNEQVAIKLEHHTVEPSLLEEEAQAYDSLAGQPGFPHVYWYGEQDDYRCLVMDLLGPNLQDLFQYCDNQFSLKTTLILADQLILRLESLHTAGYLHRDIKPENFLMGVGQNGNMVYLTDLGLVTFCLPEYYETASRQSSTREPHLLGTCRFASIQGHLGTGLSEKDDLEALGYMLVYFMKGQLPWQGLRAENRGSRYRQVLQMKETITIEELCEGLPSAFTTYMNYVRGLQARVRPNYEHLRDLFRSVALEQNIVFDDVYDWTILEYERLLSIGSVVKISEHARKVKAKKGK